MDWDEQPWRRDPLAYASVTVLGRELAAGIGVDRDRLAMLADDCRTLDNQPPGPAPTADDDPELHLLQLVDHHGRYLVTTAGQVRGHLSERAARDGEAAALGGLSLGTLPAPMPPDPAAPVLLYRPLTLSGGLLATSQREAAAADEPPAGDYPLDGYSMGAGR